MIVRRVPRSLVAAGAAVLFGCGSDGSGHGGSGGVAGTGGGAGSGGTAGGGGKVDTLESLTAEARGATQIALGWNDTEVGELGFEIERADYAGGIFLSLAATEPDVTAFTDAALYPGREYVYRLRILTAAGPSEYGNEATASTSADALPPSAKHRVLIEEATGAWCGYCPEGDDLAAQLSQAQPGVVLVARWHDSDALSISAWAELNAALGVVYGYPTGAINRDARLGWVFVVRTDWEVLTSTILAEPAAGVLRIESSLCDEALTVSVLLGLFTPLVEPVRLTVVLVEDGVTGVAQANYYNQDPESPFYELGDPIVDYVHDRVVRAMLTPVIGDEVGSTPGTLQTMTYVVDLDDAWDVSKLHVVGLLHSWGATASPHPVINVREVAVGANVGWGEAGGVGGAAGSGGTGGGGGASTVYYVEDFEGAGTLPALLPAGFATFNVDGLTPNVSVSQFDATDAKAWIVADDFSGYARAASTSWYEPVGAADDWMITPSFEIGDSGVVVSWYARAQDPDYPDGYEVWVSTTDATVSGCIANPMLFSIGAEDAHGVTRSVDLSAAGYANTSVRICFRNNSYDKFILFIDDIRVAGP